MRFVRPLILALAGLGWMPMTALAGGELVPERSRISFVSVKNVDGAESHAFTRLSGQLDDQGRFRVDIELDSVETQVPIRNERMRETLFETERFPLAQATGEVDPSQLEAIEAGQAMDLTVPFTLDLHGTQVALSAAVQVSRGTDGTLDVVSTSPVLLQAASVGLDGGIEALREIAGLTSIGKSVPVYFVLHFAGD